MFSESIHVAARIGGDEFAVLAPSTEAAGAASLAERIRTTLTGQGSGIELSVSVGIASAGADDSGDPSDLYAAADRALYRAKTAGRNRVTSAPSPPTGRLKRA